MPRKQQFAAMAIVVLVVTGALWSAERLNGDVDSIGRVGVEVTIDHRWIALEAHHVSSDRGGTVPDQAWEGEVPPRRVAKEQAVRLALLPNLVGRVGESVVVVRAVGRAALVVARYLVDHRDKSDRSAARQDNGEHDADRG